MDPITISARSILRHAVLGLALVAIPACSLPRGAALTNEIVKEENAQSPTYQVIRVSRANVPAISTWPETGTSEAFHWPQASNGPQSAIIRAGDKVDLAIWDNQENSLLTQADGKSVTMQGLTVSPSGTIFVPYLEEVVVNGQTPAQARREVQNRLASIVPSAQVQLELQPGQNNSVNLVSGVAQPGSFPLPDRNYKILSLIAQGGGIAPTLRNPQVQLQRGNATYRIRADRLFDSGAHNITLRGGDSVMVLEDKRYFTAFGATGSEELIRFEQEKITALEALSILGGLSENRANPKGVLVLRDYPASALRSDGTGPSKPQVVFAFDVSSADGLFAARKFQIQPEDTVMATESTVTSVRTILSLVGSAFGVASSVQNY
ncbi:polysaccharide biosynthesis/export family protein [Pelagivirga sediminicola]|uniref:polysaccharide biosynthesis/export family protein n=1 Tax=Pelagivirga sediminicola TaxID=2170575 RepID=UPI001FAED9AB|nr:polysaccharide biosynthesis/export family protein [Pelagivirga sediminicola]